MAHPEVTSLSTSHPRVVFLKNLNRPPSPAFLPSPHRMKKPGFLQKMGAANGLFPWPILALPLPHLSPRLPAPRLPESGELDAAIPAAESAVFLPQFSPARGASGLQWANERERLPCGKVTLPGGGSGSTCTGRTAGTARCWSRIRVDCRQAPGINPHQLTAAAGSELAAPVARRCQDAKLLYHARSACATDPRQTPLQAAGGNVEADDVGGRGGPSASPGSRTVARLACP